MQGEDGRGVTRPGDFVDRDEARLGEVVIVN